MTGRCGSQFRPKTGPSMPVNAVSETVPRWQLLMLWMARATGIAMCQIPVAVAELRESGCGYKPTRAGLVETQPSPHDLHALITPTERLNVTRSRRNVDNATIYAVPLQCSGVPPAKGCNADAKTA